MRNKNILIIIFAIVMFFGLANYSKATNYFVRINASGRNDGTNWNDAWNEMNQINWSLIQPGDYINLASGTYITELNISSSGTLSDPITIRKTTESPYEGMINMHNKININGSHLVLDGIAENGIKISIPSIGGYVDDHYIDINNGSDIIIRNIEIEGPGYDKCHAARGIQGNSDNVLVDNTFIHDFSATALRLVGNTGFVIQNSRLHNIGSKGDAACQAERGINVHSEHIAVFDGVTDFELKNSIISQQYDGELAGGFGISLALLNGGYIRIHDNIFYNVYYPIYVNSDGLGTVREFVTNGNTFVGYRVPIGGSPNDAQNNIFCNLDSYFSDTSTRSAYTKGSYNFYCDDDRYRSVYNSALESQVLASGEHPFIDYISDWRLKNATVTGKYLQAPYEYDFTVNLRGADGIWDRGAYEYISGSADTNPPAVPSGLSVL